MQRLTRFAIVVLAVAAALVVAELATTGFADFLVDHPLTTAFASGAVLILVTVAVVDETRRRRDVQRERVLMADISHVVEGAALELEKAVAGGDEDEILDQVRDVRLLAIACTPVVGGDHRRLTLLEHVFELARAAKHPGERGKVPGLTEEVVHLCSELKGDRPTAAGQVDAWRAGERGKGLLTRHGTPRVVTGGPGVYHAQLAAAHGLDVLDCLPFDIGPDGGVDAPLAEDGEIESIERLTEGRLRASSDADRVPRDFA